MQSILVAPGRYVQGVGACEEAGKQLALFGKKALVLGGKKSLGSVRDALKKSFAENGIEYLEELFGGECCDPEIERIVAVAKEKGADVIVGAGGGKAIDTAKMVALELKLPVVIIPTIAATDAPCSGLAVVYTPEGVFDRYVPMKNPDMVIVDTEVIVRAPVRLFVSGMGDALATWFEAEACDTISAANIPGGKSTRTALALAKLCYDQLINYGVEAKVACETQVVSPAFERVVEANVLLSGIGFESSGLAAAHAVHNGMTALEETHHFFHGEKVAFGTLVQLVLQDAPREVFEEVVDFCISVGLPVTLGQLGCSEFNLEKLLPVGEMACAEGDTMGNMPKKVTAKDVAQAMIAADAIGRMYLPAR
jgi:glycerol dehydrogenase